MANVFIIHGAYGNSQENWFPWLKGELENLGCRVLIPEFPTPENQSLDKWMSVFRDYDKYLEADSILVGHSLGPALILSILERLERPVKAAFFVAGFIDFLDNPDFDGINKTFVDRDFDQESIKKNCRKFYMFHSNNDPYVPIEKAEKITKSLGIDVIIVKEAGHFNKDAGYTRFEMLLEGIKKELQSSLPSRPGLSRPSQGR